MDNEFNNKINDVGMRFGKIIKIYLSILNYCTREFDSLMEKNRRERNYALWIYGKSLLNDFVFFSTIIFNIFIQNTEFYVKNIFNVYNFHKL